MRARLAGRACVRPLSFTVSNPLSGENCHKGAGIAPFESVEASAASGPDRLQASSFGAARRVRHTALVLALSSGVRYAALFVA